VAASQHIVEFNMNGILSQAVSTEYNLDIDVIKETIHKGIQGKFSGKKVLVLIPDHTRSLPLPQLFRLLVEVLSNASQLDFMVALGTHPPLTTSQMLALVGITEEERRTRFVHVGLLNHQWDQVRALKQVGTLTSDRIKEIAGELWHPSLQGDVIVRINKHIFEYDELLILGPTFPHEVVGFSGGAKYLFPGISGPEMINTTHWLGALGGVMDTIGQKETPVRQIIHAAAEFVELPIILIALVVKDEGLAGIFIGDYLNAWEAAATLSSQVHVKWCDRPFQRVLSHAPEMFDELWTAAKAMYKLESVVADGGDLIIYAPHLEVVSQVHGKYIDEIGYHTTEYFLKQWDKFKHIPLGVLAHSTHVKGAGSYQNGVESPRIKVALATKISYEDCTRLNLGYMDLKSINVANWQNLEDQGILYVAKAGEVLYQLKR
jgi:nickel-dependent lactate racemase